MLLTQIKLNNFRQFKGEHTVKFSTAPEKNVTVIIGENGSGKTTLAQAFNWCLYGETDFKNKSVLNLSLQQEMNPTDVKTVYVELILVHNDIEYTIIRNQGYEKDRTGTINHKPTRVVIHYKDKSGQIQTVLENQNNAKISEILPKELSRYFFFDGERIEKMSDEIQSGKSSEFSEAVKRLLGLNSYAAALKHLGGDKRAGKNSSVIGSYNSEYDASNDSKIKGYTEKINDLNKKIEEKTSRKETIEGELSIIISECDKLQEKIAQNRDGERLQADCNRKRDEIRKNNTFIDNSTESILNDFKNNYRFYFYRKIVGDALEALEGADKVDKGVPDINERTIKFLFQRGFCICGNEICDGSAEKKALEELLDYIPPQSLGTMIREFSKDCKIRAEYGDNKYGDNIYSLVRSRLRDVEDKREENDRLNEEIEQLEERLKTFENIGQSQSKLSSYREERRKKENEQKSLIAEISKMETERDRQETERDKFALQSETNKKVVIYRTYAKKIYDILSAHYKMKETEVRKKLEQAINEIFLTIYNGGLSLKIDSNYNIRTEISDDSSYKGYLEDTSTAQSISIIFAFIAGVIKVARESGENTNSYDLSAEAYPLVMDAPLSSFDKRRIKTVCDTLPGIAEQVIIFIKDTDGEIAESYLSEKIGASYEFLKISETETCFKERS